jgi:Protein of unknown function (DUF3795)
LFNFKYTDKYKNAKRDAKPFLFLISVGLLFVETYNEVYMDIEYPDIGVCGLSCKLCPRYHTDGVSRCNGCKTESRMGAGCPFITCALKKKQVEFCGDCKENSACDKWKKHRVAGRSHDSFKCYQKLEDDIAFIAKYGKQRFIETQEAREAILKEMLANFNEGRSKSYYCIAVTVLDIGELEQALDEARKAAVGQDMKGRARALYAALDAIAVRRNYNLKLRR